MDTANEFGRDASGRQAIAVRTWSDHASAVTVLGASFLPFAAGYFISYLFRTVNATIAGRLIFDLKLDAQHLGLLTSAYFLTFAMMQIPVGVAIDRYGPRRVQVVLLSIVAVGALLFANATQFWQLMLGRAFIGAGASASLIAGLKTIRQFFPHERQPLANGIFIAIGTAGAVSATVPVDRLLVLLSWRELFLMLAAMTAFVAILVAYLPAEERQAAGPVPRPFEQLRQIYLDRRFWRLAPLSAICIGTAWGLHGLWAGPWLTDVASLDHPAVVRHLFLMGMALCASALFLGVLSDALRRISVSNETIFGAAVVLFIVAQLGLIFRPNVSLALLWSVIAGMGASTVLSYAILARYFPKEIAGQANAALNILHIGGAFLIQSSIGLIVGTWPHDEEGHYPPAAYASAFLFLVLLQAVALGWFAWAGRRAYDTLPGEDLTSAR